jgi:hypothetical protein
VGTCPRSISRRHEQKTNTVLFCFGLSPVEYLPVCPWCHSFSKRFISVFFLASFKPLEIFHPKGIDFSPRKKIQVSVDEILPLSDSSELAFGSRDPSLDLISDSLEIFSIELPVRIREELIDSLVNSEGSSGNLRFLVFALNPQNQSCLREATALDEISTTEPFIKGLSFSGRNSDSVTLFQGRDPDYEIEGLFSLFHGDEFTIQDSRTREDRARGLFSEFFGRFFGSDDCFQSLFEGIRFIAFGKSSVLESGQGIFIQGTRARPEGLGVEIDSGSIGLKESQEGLFLFDGEEFSSYFTGTSHNSTDYL